MHPHLTEKRIGLTLFYPTYGTNFSHHEFYVTYGTRPPDLGTLPSGSLVTGELLFQYPTFQRSRAPDPERVRVRTYELEARRLSPPCRHGQR